MTTTKKMKIVNTVCLALVLGAHLPLSVQTVALPAKASLTVKIQGFSNDQGSAGIALWGGSGQGFPDQTSKAMRSQFSAIREKAATITFEDLMPGSYAVSVYHDENGNKKFDKNFLGIPREAWGVSNNPKSRLRTPRFDEARTALSEGSNSIVIQVR